MSLIIETDEEERDKKTRVHSSPRQKKDEAVTSTTSLSGEHPERSQSKETSTIIGTRQRRSNQFCQRSGPQFVERSNSRERKYLWEIETA